MSTECSDRNREDKHRIPCLCTTGVCPDHPYNIGDRVQIIAGGPMPGTITSIGWEFGPFVHVKLDRDRNNGQEGVYKFGCGEFIKPISAVDQLAEIAP